VALVVTVSFLDDTGQTIQTTPSGGRRPKAEVGEATRKTSHWQIAQGRDMLTNRGRLSCIDRKWGACRVCRIFINVEKACTYAGGDNGQKVC
jgi:hypothetical protein